jgi:hypothetical protein
VRLRIEPVWVDGVMSWGTIAHIRVVREELGVGLADAKAIVDRCVFGDETVDIPVESAELAIRLRERLRDLSHLPPKVTVTLLVDGVPIA